MIQSAREQSHVSICSLLNLMEAVNAFQTFLKSDIQGKQNALIWEYIYTRKPAC